MKSIDDPGRQHKNFCPKPLNQVYKPVFMATTFITANTDYQVSQEIFYHTWKSRNAYSTDSGIGRRNSYELPFESDKKCVNELTLNGESTDRASWSIHS